MTDTSLTNTTKKAVLLVGAGFGALKVAEDMAQSGVPLVWVTKALHFLELPGSHEHFTEWPDDLSFQFRPLYLRVTRNPLVTPMTHARVESIQRGPDGYKAIITQDPVYVDYDLCSGCGRCMEVCPLKDSNHPPLSRTPAYCPSRALILDKRQLSACRTSCPLGVNVQAYMALTAASRFDEALAVIREDNPLPGICGRICHHPCEASCRRKELDVPVAIRDIKRFLADYEAHEGTPKFDMPQVPKRKERVAIIGSGPAGLTAAHYLNRAGFPVTIFEAHSEAGGMLRVGINSFRLPRTVLDTEIRAIVDMGVEILTGTRVNSIRDLFDKGFQSVLVSVGAHRDIRLNIPGEDAEGVFGSVEMLRACYSGQQVKLGKHVAVIGGGNSAIDAARAAIRLGAETVTIYYRRERKDMPAHEAEIQAAEEEGIRIEYLATPVRIIVKEGRVSGLELVKMKLGELDASGRGRPEPIEGSNFNREADTVIVSISQQPDLGEMCLGYSVDTDRASRIKVDDGLSASRDGVFAAGDVVTGPSTVIESMAQGRKAAARIIEYLTGEPAPFVEIPSVPRGVGDYLEISEDAPRRWRPEMAQRQPKVRRRDFEEVNLGFTTEQAVAEARRCLQCSACCECRICETVCAEMKAIDHYKSSNRLEFISPVVIVADNNELPSSDTIDQEGIYRLGDFQKATDLMDVLVAGSAVAGKSMSECASLRYPTFPLEPKSMELEEEARFGVFICKCNETMAPAKVLERIRDLAASIPGVVHSELIFSACHPRGSKIIADMVREHNLSRVILASCVCCPLEFQCIACNDQRNRARIQLFNQLGLDRSRFETINIKDHLLTGTQSEDEVVEKARDFLRSAFISAKLLGSLRQGSTEIGNRILILGGSKVGISCALNLDLQGFNVRLVHRCKLRGGPDIPQAIKERPVHLVPGKSITNVEEAEIGGISGQLGDFSVVLRENGVLHKWRADIVCLTDENILPLAIHEDTIGLKKFYRYNFAFFHTPQIGLYRVMPRTLKRVNAFEAGAALAAQVATAAAEAFLKDHELSPKIDSERCRGCGRCADICPFDAIKMVGNKHEFYTAEVVRYNCVGCGGCVGRCPVTAMDMPYFSNRLLEEIVAGTMAGER